MDKFDVTQDMWKEIPFKRNEFQCECGCGFGAVDAELLRILINLRNKFGIVFVSGGNRCSSHNREIGGRPKSYHLMGMAADVKFPESDLGTVWNYLTDTYRSKYGFILYRTFIHIDARLIKYREAKH